MNRITAILPNEEDTSRTTVKTHGRHGGICANCSTPQHVVLFDGQLLYCPGCKAVQKHLKATKR